jgi:hypothetical protein
MNLWNWRQWGRGSQLTCTACGGRFRSGVIRFENGRKAGSLCQACTDGRDDDPVRATPGEAHDRLRSRG